MASGSGSLAIGHVKSEIVGIEPHVVQQGASRLVRSAPSIHLDTHILPIDPFAGPMILDVEVRLEAQPIVVDPEQLPGRA
jgi:hypothetical protein